MRTKGGRSADSPIGDGGWTLAVGFIALGVVIPAGGLGVALVAGLVGLITAIGLLVRHWSAVRTVWQWRAIIRDHKALCAWSAFFVWCSVTWLWSPFEDSQYVIRFVLSAPLYFALVAHAQRLTHIAKLRVQIALLIACLAAASVFAFEVVTAHAITAANAPDGRPFGEVKRTLGHGLSALIALLPATLVLLWRGGAWSRSAAMAMTAVAAIGGASFGLSSNVLGLIFALAGLALALLTPPSRAVIITGLFAACSVVLSPLMAAMAHLPASWRRALPLTWEYRIEIWAYSFEEYLRAPVVGHGFDAARTFDEYRLIRGQELDVMQLHPHNAGLHILFETGIVGGVLFGLAMMLTVLRVSRSGDRALQRAAAGALTGCAAMAAVSYGVWQEWWIATGFFAAAGCAVASNGANR